MIEWKEKAFDTLLKIDRNTKVPKKIIKRVHNIITVMCAHCRVLYPNFNIYCYDKSLEVFPFADESGIELDHIFNSSVRSEAHFEILLNEQNKIICNAYIFYGADCALVYSQTYEGNNISKFINNVFDDWYENDCENIQIISKDEI